MPSRPFPRPCATAATALNTHRDACRHCGLLSRPACSRTDVTISCCGLPAQSCGWVVRQPPKVQPTVFVSTLRFACCSLSLGPGFEVWHAERWCFHRNVSTALRVTQCAVQNIEALLSHARTHTHTHTHASLYFIPHQRKRTRRILSFLFRICTADSDESV